MNPKSALSAAVNAWHRLWSVGANGENINRQNSTQQQRTTPNYRSSPNSNQDSFSPPRQTRESTNNRTKHYNQQDLFGHNQEVQDAEPYGDIMERKPQSTLRIMLHNVNRLPLNAKHDKSKKLFSTIANKQIDIALITEVGINWKKANSNDRWYERTRNIFQSSKSETAHNINEPQMTANIQFGGVAITAVDDCSHRVISQGSDPTGLGRWAWMRLEGKSNHHLRVISAYRPVDSTGPGTVYEQHLRYFTTKFRKTDPRTAFYEDLYEEIIKWKEMGDHLIIGIDANEDVRTGLTSETFRAADMKEIILNTHTAKSPPATCDKNTNREPIDGIFTTANIRLQAGGYSAFSSGCPSDHRYLWIDVSFQDVFGHKSPPLVSPPIRRLNNRNPKLVERYNTQLKKAYQTHHLPEALEALEIRATTEGWSSTLEDEYNRINDEQYSIRKKIKAKIHHLPMGQIPWSPCLQKFRTAIQKYGHSSSKKGRDVRLAQAN